MNYPYGEHFMYTDCHPILVIPLKFLADYFPCIIEYQIGILNSLMILSILLTAIVLLLLFYELNIHYLLAALGAFGITVLSPQIFRLTGHFALSYSFMIPLVILLLIKYTNKSKNSYLAILTALILISFFTHAYLGMIATVLVLTYAFLDFLISTKKSIIKPIPIFISSAFPLGVFYFFVKLTDTHTGRTTNPWGIFDNHADPITVFLPTHPPFKFIKNWLFPTTDQSWEGWAYIGIFTILALLFYTFIFLKTLIKNQKLQFDTFWVDNKIVRTLLLSGFVILAFSMLLPFRLGMKELLEYIEPIKQFRSIGRFAWVFYFTSTIFLIDVTNTLVQYLINRKKVLFGYTLLILIPVSLAVEGLAYHSEVSKTITQSPNLFDRFQLDQQFQQDLNTINSKDFQAIIPFPYYYIGSENFGKSPD